MSSAQFKLTKPGGLTRRAQFHSLPSWIALASKIQSLYDIPVDKVGVSYIDSDGDEVTFSSEDELQDFYATQQPNQTIKLAVQDLGSARESASALGSATQPQSNSNYRHTFGQESALGFPDEEEWQTVPPAVLFGVAASDSSGGPQAHIEELSSNASSVPRYPESEASSFATPVMDKGKGKLVNDDDVSTTGSVLISEANIKYPVHVLDVADEGMVDPPVRSVEADTEGTPLAAQGTLQDDKQNAADEADPPLPSVEAPPAPAPAPSLTNDVATFLSTLTTVISAHPELSEGLRHITRSATNGAYWSAHREAVTRAAEDIRRSVVEESGQLAGEYKRRAEEEAGRRVADALGGLMQMFGEMRTDLDGGDAARAGPGARPAEPDVDNTDSDSDNIPNPNTFARHPRGGGHGRGGGGPHRRPASWADSPFGSPWGQAPWIPGAPQMPGMFPPPFGPPPPPGPHGRHPHHHGRFPGPPPPPPGAFTPFGPQGPGQGPAWAQGPPSWDYNHGRSGHRHHGGDRGDGPNSAAAAHAPGWVGAEGAGPSDEKVEKARLEAAEMRAKVEEAKAKYKMEKEAYRRARGERKFADMQGDKNAVQDASAAVQNAKDIAQDAKGLGQSYASAYKGTGQSHASLYKGIGQSYAAAWGGKGDRDAKPVPPPVPAGISQIVSNARGPYPELEMVSVPGPMARPHRRTASASEQDAQAIKRITRRIADMGFTETAFPHLPARIRDLLAAKKPTTKEGEDDVVTSLLEELLAAPQASGSTLRPQGENVPGAWN